MNTMDTNEITPGIRDHGKRLYVLAQGIADALISANGFPATQEEQVKWIRHWIAEAHLLSKQSSHEAFRAVFFDEPRKRSRGPFVEMKVEAIPGQDVKNAIENAVRVANRTGALVRLEECGTVFLCYPGDAPDLIHRTWQDAIQRRPPHPKVITAMGPK